MLQLYFYPMACSLASRMVLMEAGIEARYHLADIFTKKILDEGEDFRVISAKEAVPVLLTEDGRKLTENVAVLQYIADLRPDLGLAPSPASFERYRLQEWLSFVSTEIHKGFLFPSFWYADDAAKAGPRERIGKSLGVAAAHLREHSHLVGDSFTVADAYFAWSLLPMKRCGIDIGEWPPLIDYLGRIQQRPKIKEAIEIEVELRKKIGR